MEHKLQKKFSPVWVLLLPTILISTPIACNLSHSGDPCIASTESATSHQHEHLEKSAQSEESHPGCDHESEKNKPYSTCCKNLVLYKESQQNLSNETTTYSKLNNTPLYKNISLASPVFTKNNSINLLEIDRCKFKKIDIYLFSSALLL